MRERLNFGRYDYASFSGYVMYASCTMAIPVVLLGMSESLNFGLGAGGALHLCRSVTMLVTMLAGGFIASRFGKAAPLGTAMLVMGGGLLCAAFAPSYAILFLAVAVAGLGEGIYESLVTPFIQDRHRDNQPGRYINFTHAFWSVGVVAAVTGATLAIYAGMPWRHVLAAVGILALAPGVIFLLPKRGRQAPVATGFSVLRDSRVILRDRRFLLFLAAMFLAGGGEHCLTFWTPSFIEREFGGGILMSGAGTVCFAVGMICGRILSGIYIKQNRLFHLLTIVSLLGFLFGLMPPFLKSPVLLFTVMFIMGITAGPVWPSIQSYCVDRLQGKNETMMLVLLPCVGVPGCGVFTWLMGLAGEHFGFRWSFFFVSFCYGMLFLVLLSERLFFRTGNKSAASDVTNSGLSPVCERPMEGNPSPALNPVGTLAGKP